MKATAMPKQELLPVPGGTPAQSVILKQQQDAELQVARNKIGGSGSSSSSIVVPSVPSGSVMPQQTSQNYAAITKVAQQQAANSVFDKAKTPADTVQLQQQQQQQQQQGGDFRGGQCPCKWCRGLKTGFMHHPSKPLHMSSQNRKRKRKTKSSRRKRRKTRKTRKTKRR